MSHHPMTDTTRDLIQRLVDALTNAIRVIYNEDGTQHISTAAPVLNEARAFLAQPEPEYPSDKKLLELMPETMKDEFSYAAKVSSDATGGQVKPGIFRVALNTSALEYAKAVLEYAETLFINRDHELVANNEVQTSKKESEKENEQHFKKCLEIIKSVTREELIELMGEEFLEEFRRISQR